MASSCSRRVPNGDYFSIPASAQRSQNVATPPTYWDTKLCSELSLASSDSTVPSPASPNPLCYPPRAYSLPELYHGSIKTEEDLDLQPYDSFMQWEDSIENSMDPTMSHFFPELKLENTFSPVITGFETHTNPMLTGLASTDTIMSGTIHDPASVFGEDPITEGPLFETPAVNSPLNNLQQRKAFYEAPSQQPSYPIPQANGPVTRGTAAAALKTDISSPQDTRFRNIAMPVKSYAPPSPSSASSASPPPVTARTSRRKRKSSDSDDEDDESPPDTKDHHGRQHAPVKKTAHNMIEKRYRTNLNDKIAALRDCVPSLRVTSGTGTGTGTGCGVKKGKGDTGEDLQGLSPAHKLNKATVLSKAAEYIMHLEKRNKALCKENAAYKGRIEAFEILMLTTKNSNTTTTTSAPLISATSSNSSRSGSGSFDSTTSGTSLSECGAHEAVEEDTAEEMKMKMSEEEEVLKNELDVAGAH
ncbi:helix-loop-helix DNA-binding domain-containing protein [Xylogone sp. PMI_703]|nr:helix-loop-helix DNA-binding domain-containing protein [Xylogone sp. PMI_703]